ncbi:MAG: hypothetical protein KTR31_31605 [Myxococcales bacterium]|nr:hypothetical protein [Myxococcales bacterium]
MSPLLTALVRAARRDPTTRDAVARLVADEDAAALGRLLEALGACATAEELERLLDEPGPFRPSVRGWT